MDRTVPEQVVCTVTYNELPVERVAISAILETDFKNNYSTIFGPTDKNGQAQLNRGRILHEAAEDWKMGLMDFGPIEECFTGKVFLHIMNIKELEGAQSAYQLFKDSVEYPPNYQKLLQESIDSLKELEIKKLKLHAHAQPARIELVIDSEGKLGQNN